MGIQKRSLAAFAATDLFFTPGVGYCFLAVFRFPEGSLARAILACCALAACKLAVLLTYVWRQTAPLEAWQRGGRRVTDDALTRAATAAYEGPIALGRMWSIMWGLYLTGLSAWTLSTEVGMSSTRALLVIVGFVLTVLIGAATLGTILAGFLFAPLAAPISIEAHERDVAVAARSGSLRAQLRFLAYGLCMAPTFFLTSFILAKTSTSDAVVLSMYFFLPVVFGAIGAIALSAMFSGSISGVADVLGQIGRSGGRLEGIRRVPIYFRNELGDVAERANVMVDRLNDARQKLDTAHEAAIRAEKLASVGQLAATIGHELRNPLAAVRNAHVYTMRRIAQAEMVKSDPRLGQMLDVASRELDACSRLIGDLLDFARERPLQREPLPLCALVDEAISLVPQRTSVTVVSEVAEDLPLVELDREQFRRVVINLVQNAVEAFPDGVAGSVRVAARKDKAWELTIADDGPGIAADVAARIFEPLFTTKTKGTGLGLAVVRSIVERHGGTIELTTAVGEGARFRIAWGTIPA